MAPPWLMPLIPPISREAHRGVMNNGANSSTTDRPLQHINKKGRPVSQCQHCRAMRKSRSSHIKCDCGEKTHKCVHLRPAVEGHKGEHRLSD